MKAPNRADTRSSSMSTNGTCTVSTLSLSPAYTGGTVLAL